MSSQSSIAKLSLVFFLGLPSSAALAQSEPLNTLPDTIVSATSLPTPSDEIGSSVTVITGEQLQRDQIRTVVQALQTVPGLNVVQNGAAGGQAAVFIRGGNSAHVKVLIDGVDVSDPSSPNNAFDFGPLTTADIERIEVLRGPQSGLYGADAMSGVISITTKKGAAPAKWTATVEGGSYGTFNKSLGVSGGTQNTNYNFSVSNYLSASVPVTPLNILPLVGATRRNNDYTNNWTYAGRFGADLSDTFSVNFAGRYTEQTLRFTNFDFNDQSHSTGYYFSGLGEGIWKLWDGRFVNHVGVAYTDVSRWALDPGNSPSDNTGDRTKYFWKSELDVAKGQKLLMGVEREIETDNSVTQFSTTNASNGNTGTYLELHSAITDRLFLTSNVRFDDNDSFGGHTTWRIAPSYLIRETGTKLKASYGTAFKAPSLEQLYQNQPGFQIANPNLRPEESEGYDYGFEQSLFNDRAQFGVTWFNNRVQNLIDNDPITFKWFNVARASSNGYEAFASAKITDTLQIRADYTHIGITAQDFTTASVLLFRRPREKTSVSAVWQPTEKLSFSATALWVSNWFDGDRVAFVPVLTPSYHFVNLAANYDVNDHLKVFGRIDNLLDQHYQTVNGFEHTGIGFFGGIRLVN